MLRVVVSVSRKLQGCKHLAAMPRHFPLSPPGGVQARKLDATCSILQLDTARSFHWYSKFINNITVTFMFLCPFSMSLSDDTVATPAMRGRYLPSLPAIVGSFADLPQCWKWNMLKDGPENPASIRGVRIKCCIIGEHVWPCYGAWLPYTAQLVLVIECASVHTCNLLRLCGDQLHSEFVVLLSRAPCQNGVDSQSIACIAKCLQVTDLLLHMYNCTRIMLLLFQAGATFYSALASSACDNIALWSIM